MGTQREEGMKRFQKITTEHLGTPFGRGQWNRGNFLWRNLCTAEQRPPAKIAVSYVGNRGKSWAEGSMEFAVSDYDGDGKLDDSLWKR